MEEKLISLNFVIDQIIFQNKDNGYGVVSGTLNTGEAIFAVGQLFGIDVGQRVSALGKFISHKTYGKQFQIESFKQSFPSNEIAIRNFLASGAIKGIGPVLCNRIVDYFKEDTLHIMENSPDDLLKVKGFSKNLVNKIKQNINQLFSMKRLLMFLEEFNLKPIYGIKAWRKWNIFALDKIKINPFILCEDGVDLPFLEADIIAKKFGFNSQSMERVEGAIKFILKHNALDNGHTCAPEKSVINIVSKFIGIDLAKIKAVVDDMILKKQLFCFEFNEKRFLFLPLYFLAEQFIAERVLHLKDITEQISDQDFNNMLKIEEDQFEFELVENQKQAIKQAISNGIFILTGGPGTGKTTVLKGVISILEQRGFKVAICAPTGRAAKRLFELTGRLATTIHRLLGVCSNIEQHGNELIEFVHDQHNILDYDVVVVDEMSMVDCLLFCSLLKAIKLDCRLILTGDCNQLPSVAAGNILKNLVECNLIAQVKLTKIFRQAAESLIVKNAHAIVNGEKLILNKPDGNFFLLNEYDPQKIANLAVDIATKRLINRYGYDPIVDIQVICLLKKGLIGTINLNKMLQSKINNKQRGKAEFKFGFYIYREGDKVMQVKNDYEIKWQSKNESGEGIFNGDIGILKTINKKDKTFQVDFDGKLATYTFDKAYEIELAYAITVHKSQGNEFKSVVILCNAKSGEFFSRNLLYTAITRAKDMLVVVGPNSGLSLMCKQVKVNYRYSGLKHIISKNLS